MSVMDDPLVMNLKVRNLRGVISCKILWQIRGMANWMGGYIDRQADRHTERAIAIATR